MVYVTPNANAKAAITYITNFFVAPSCFCYPLCDGHTAVTYVTNHVTVKSRSVYYYFRILNLFPVRKLFAGLHRKPNWLPANGVKHRASSSSSYSPFIFWVKLVIMSFFSYLACNYRFWFFLIRIVVVIVNFCLASNCFYSYKLKPLCSCSIGVFAHSN